MAENWAQNVVMPRPAGMLERYFITRHYLKIDTCVMVSAHYVDGDSQKPLDRRTLLPALSCVLDRVPALSLTILDAQSDHPQLARLRSLNTNQCIEFVEDHTSVGYDAFERLLEREFLVPYGAVNGTPLWKLIVLNGQIVTFVFHHVFGEGASGAIFHQNLLASLNEQSVSNLSSDGADVMTWRLKDGGPDDVPPIEDMTDMTVSWTSIFRLISKRLLTSSAYRSSVWTGDNVPTVPTYQNRAKILDLSAHSLSQLTQLCRAHKASITAAVYTLALATLSTLGSARRTGIKRIAMSVPVSLRHYTRVPLTDVCLHFSSYHADADLLPTGFSWEYAASFTKTLRESLPECKQQLGLLKYIKNYDRHFRRKLGGPRDGLIEISSVVSSFSVPKSEEDNSNGWRITKVFGFQNDGSMAMRMAIAGDPEIGATLCVTWGAGSDQDELALAFIRMFKAGLDRLLEDSKHARAKL